MPVGTILAYSGSLADIPNGWHLCDGTDGTPNLLDNRFLEGDATVGIFKDPGLPNIIGTAGSVIANLGTTGAFGRQGHYVYGTSWNHSNYGLTFNAENGRKYWHQQIYGNEPTDTIFGNSATVQPKAYTVLYIIKIK